jgi:ATP/maltotriose-dependent transcriptional regulator MalT
VLGDARARGLLDEVTRMNLFVTALDPDRTWFRYHHMFAETLRGELERREPQLVGELNRRASEWFAQAGMSDDAIEHALLAGDGPRAASLLATSWLPLITSRRHVTVRRILDRMPEQRGEFGPLCEALDVLCMIYEGVDQRITAERAAALAAKHGDDPHVRLVVDGMLISPFYGDVGRAVEVGREAMERYADFPDVQVHIGVRFALVLWFAGDYERVRGLLEPRVLLEQPSFSRVWTLAILAMTAADEGDAELAERFARDAMAEVEAVAGETATEFTGVPCVLGEALRQAGKLEEARHYLSVGLANEARRPGSVGHAVALTYDAQLALAEGNRSRARRSARRARAIVDRYRDLGTLGPRLAGVEAALDGSLLGSEPTGAELRVLRLLDSQRTLAEIASELYVTRDTVKSHVRRLYRRLGESTRAGAIATARERGLL